MKLGTYLSENGITHADFAARIGTSQAAVTRYVLEQRTPRPDVISRIMSITSGEVTANDFMPAYPAPAPTHQEGAA